MTYFIPTSRVSKVNLISKWVLSKHIAPDLKGEVPGTCILSNGQQWVTPLVESTSHLIYSCGSAVGSGGTVEWVVHYSGDQWFNVINLFQSQVDSQDTLLFTPVYLCIWNWPLVFIFHAYIPSVRRWNSPAHSYYITQTSDIFIVSAGLELRHNKNVSRTNMTYSNCSNHTHLCSSTFFH